MSKKSVVVSIKQNAPVKFRYILEAYFHIGTGLGLARVPIVKVMMPSEVEDALKQLAAEGASTQLGAYKWVFYPANQLVKVEVEKFEEVD